MGHGSESSNPVLSFLLYASVIKKGDSELWVKGEYHDNFADVRKVSRDNLSREKQPRLFDRTDWVEKLYEHCLSGYPPLFLRARVVRSAAVVSLYHDERRAYCALAPGYLHTLRAVYVGSTRLKTHI